MPQKVNLAAYIDHTVLKPTTTIADVQKCCLEAREYAMAAVCVPPPYVALAKELLQGSAVKVATVIGFPFGYAATEAKLAEIIKAIEAGADELDMVHNLAALKNGDWNFLEEEMRLCSDAIHFYDKTLKVIIESSELTDEEIIRCCTTYAPLAVDYLKTSTGYASSGASVHAVALMKKHLPETIKIKASGGIRDYETALQMVTAGANRLGCSASLKILGEAPIQ